MRRSGARAATWQDRVRRLCLFLSLLLGLVVPAAGQTPGEETAEEAPRQDKIAVEGRQPADTRIAERIRGIFAEVGGFERVSVNVREGVVTLSGRVVDPAKMTEAAEIAERVEGVVTVRSQIEEVTSVEERLTPAFDRFVNRLRQIIAFLPLLAVALLIVLLVSGAGLAIARLKWPWSAITPNAFLADLLRQVVRLVFVALGLVIALDLLGATALLGTVLGAAGIVGLAIGFAVRDTVENYIASILLSLRQPFQPNDFVRIDQDEGHVIRLTSRATILMTLDGNHLRIPNAQVFKAVIVNYTRNPERRFDMRLGVDADADLTHALGVGLEALHRLDYVLATPAPLGWIEEVGESNVVLFFAGWVDQRVTDFMKARGHAVGAVKVALEAGGVGLPEPIYRVRLEEAAQSGSSVARRRPPAPPGTADITKVDPIAAKVAQERAHSSEKDLLDPSAPQEI
jgi:small conductance mechanosensitive channel